MNNFEQMRENMIISQFLPGLIKNKKIIEVFGSIPRENFLPENFMALAYSDLNIKITNNRYLPSPFNTAKIFQEAELQGSEMVLLIGANLGYETAVISKLVDTIVAVEEDLVMKNKAENNIKKLNIENILLVSASHRKGYKKLGPYDLIIILESQVHIEGILKDQLVDGGRLFYCEKQKSNIHEAKLTVYYRNGKNFSKRQLYDLNIPSFLDKTLEESKFNFI